MMNGAGPGGAGSRPRPRLRRGLFGVKAADVERALAERDAELDELRKDLAALWQAYAQHDRAIREALSKPSEDEASAAGKDGSRPTAAERRAGIEAQLSGLDEALAAIEQATQTLENAYRAPSPAAEDPGQASEAESRPQP